ncbi:MAG: copper-binding protein [Pyrinomonadaceae bacterium]
MSLNLLPIILSTFLILGCTNKPANVKVNAPKPTPVPASSVIKNGEYPGKGKVTKINLEIGSVEMDHEEIKGVMPPMRMEFYVTDKKILDGVTLGDSIDFTLLYKDGTEKISSIKKAQ